MNRDFLRPVGIVDRLTLPVPEPAPTMRLSVIPRHEEETVEFDIHTNFVVIAQECERGLPLFDDLVLTEMTIEDLVRVVRDLLRLLRYLARKDIHYRDVYLGNAALKRNREELLSGDDAVLILYDFGNSRYLDEPCGGSQP